MSSILLSLAILNGFCPNCLLPNFRRNFDVFSVMQTICVNFFLFATCHFALVVFLSSRKVVCIEASFCGSVFFPVPYFILDLCFLLVLFFLFYLYILLVAVSWYHVVLCSLQSLSDLHFFVSSVQMEVVYFVELLSAPQITPHIFACVNVFAVFCQHAFTYETTISVFNYYIY